MVEELHVEQLLKEFNGGGFEIGERVILGHFGTVQTLLALILNTPIEVKVMVQNATAASGQISRQVNLVAKDQLICEASSIIPVKGNRPEVIEDICQGQMGLGQIIAKYELKHTRRIKEIGRDHLNFWRTYEINGPVVNMEIHEFFYKRPFFLVGWL